MKRTLVQRAAGRATAGIVAMALAGLGLIATSSTAMADIAPTPVPPQERTADMVTGDVLPTVQINSGVVWAQAVVGDTVYAGGSFSQTRPAGATAGQQLTPRANLLAYDIKTGELLPFAPQVNGVVKSIQASPDGKTLYVGGSFTNVNGKGRYLVAAFDVATGELLDTWRPAVGGSYVNAITVTDTTVYVGGLFTQANGVKRTNVASFDLAGNLTGWAPTTNGQVDAMVMNPSGSRLIIGGRFTTVNGKTAPCTAALDPATATSLPWIVNTVITGGGSPGSGVMGLSTDGKYIYGTGWLQMSWYFEGVWAVDPETGAIVWIADGQGDMYDVFPVNGVVYGVGHTHYATMYGGWPNYNAPNADLQFSQAMTAEPKGTLLGGGRANLVGKPAPGLIQWYPAWLTGTATGAYQAGWTIEGNSDYVVVGGEFIGLNGRLQQGLARFTKPSIATSTQGPRKSGAPRVPADQWEAPTFRAVTGGTEISIRPNYDRDDRTLTYELYRDGGKTPVATTTFDSDPWLRTTQTVTLKDTTALPKTTYSYVVKAVDGDGNSAVSSAVKGTTSDFELPLRAAVTAGMSGFTGHFDASGTTAPKGAKAVSWAWDFGDGSTGDGQSVDHAFPQAGEYTVKVTVTDDKGNTSEATTKVTADAAIARDAFERTVTGNKWGTAEVGGDWTTDRGAKVADGVGVMTMSAAQSVNGWLPAAKSENTDLTMTFTLDKASAGGGTFVSGVVRRTDAGEYRSKIVVNADGTVSVYLSKIVDGKETVLKPAVLPNTTVGANTPLQVRFQAVSGDDGSTTLRVRVWPAGTQEPTAWFLTTTDKEPGLQGPGSVGISSYLSAASTLGTQTIRIDNFEVTTP